VSLSAICRSVAPFLRFLSGKSRKDPSATHLLPVVAGSVQDFGVLSQINVVHPPCPKPANSRAGGPQASSPTNVVLACRPCPY
jgi:hypothetical protein